MADENNKENSKDTDSPLEALTAQLDTFSEKLKHKDKEANGRPFRVILSSWQLAPYKYADLAEKIDEFSSYLRAHDYQSSEDFNQILLGITEKFKYLDERVLPHFSSSIPDSISAVRVFSQTIDLARQSTNPYQTGLTEGSVQKKLLDVNKKINVTKLRLENSCVLLSGIDEKIERITKAAETADNLPVTLKELAEANEKIQEVKRESEKAKAEISSCELRIKDVDLYASDAKKIIESISTRCDEILMKSTGVGLAASFTKRSKELIRATKVWTFVLTLSLIAVVFSAYWRSSAIMELMLGSERANSLVVFANYAISVLAIGAPIWLAWLATKQIGYNFRLSEDYAFKASVSQAYEGFRREAHNQGGDLERKILESIVGRYDQEPLRYVATSVHGSPVHEILDKSFWNKFHKVDKGQGEKRRADSTAQAKLASEESNNLQ